MNHTFVHCDPKQFKGQFLLTAEDRISNEKWICSTYKNWKLFTADLAVINVHDERDGWIGWCVGHPIIDGVLEPQKIVLKKSANKIDPYEEFYNRAAGKWILILLEAEHRSIYLDPFGALSAVYSSVEKTVASTPTLIGSDADWDREFMREMEFPEKQEWLPGGLTFKKNVYRLLPNHWLNLNAWEVARHWPNRHTDLSIVNDTARSVHAISTMVTASIHAIADRHPLCLTLTSGRDSRAVLACAKNRIQGTKVVTFAREKETLEMHIASRIARQLSLDYRFLPISNASPKEMENWLQRTGFSTSGDIWKIHKTLEQLDPERVLLPGLSAELHKGIKWERSDRPETKLSATQILKRWKIPNHPRIVNAIEKWMAELDFVNILHTLDLFHIEQRLGCWAAPAYYANITSRFELPVFNQRRIAQVMMRLPISYRRKKQFSIDLCRQTWPELLHYPFNEYPGVYGFFRSKAKAVKNIYKKMVE